MPESVDLHSSGLRRSSRLAALHSSETIESHSTLSKTIGPSSTFKRGTIETTSTLSKTIGPSSTFQRETIETTSTLSKTIGPSSKFLSEAIEPHSTSSKTIGSSSKFQLVVASVANECSKGSSKKTTQCTMNNLRQNRSFVDDDVSIDSWQCPMKIDEVNFQQVGNCASTELVGSCHDEKSERAGCIASTQKDSTFQLIVGFKQYHQSLTLNGEHFIASNYAAPSILCSTPHWLIVENIIPGAHVIPNISCEEPHGLIVTKNVPSNFERELAFDDKASFDSNFFGQKSKLIVVSIPSYEGAQRATSKLNVICAFGLNELIKLISASRHQQLIVAYVKTNSKIYLIFGEECRTFCEGEWEQQVGNISLTRYQSN